MFLLLGRIELKLFRCGIGPDRKFWLACVLSLRCVLDVRNDGIFSRYIPCLRVGVLFFTASFIHDLYPPSCRITGIAVKSSQCGSSLMISVFSCTTCYIFQRQGLVTMDIWYSTPPTAAEIKSGWQQSPVPLPLRLPSLSPYFLSVTFRGGRWRASDRGIFYLLSLARVLCAIGCSLGYFDMGNDAPFAQYWHYPCGLLQLSVMNTNKRVDFKGLVRFVRQATCVLLETMWKGLLLTLSALIVKGFCKQKIWFSAQILRRKSGVNLQITSQVWVYFRLISFWDSAFIK